MSRNSTPSFLLEKHYLDCTDNDGNCIIVYSAHLCLGPLKLCYSSVITSMGDQKSAENSSWSAAFIETEEGAVRLINKSLGIKGEWISKSGNNPRFKYEENRGGSLLWDCYQPISSVVAEYDGITIKGLGYAETISLTMMPWKLPIRDLYWGRFYQQAILLSGYSGQAAILFQKYGIMATNTATR